MAEASEAVTGPALKPDSSAEAPVRDGAPAGGRRDFRVMHVITGLYTGGAERMLSELVLASRERASSIFVVSLLSGGTTFDRLSDTGIRLANLGMKRGRPSLRAVFRLARLIREWRPAVVQSWMYHADLIAIIALFASGRRRHTRLFWGVRCSNMDVRRYRPALNIVLDLCSWLSPFPDGVIANSFAGRTFHERLGYRARRFVVIDNGTDTDLFRPNPEARQRMRRELGIPTEQPLLALPARLDPMKDHGCFVAALDRLPDVAALAIGGGTERLPPRPRLYRLGERSDMPALLAACDLVISPSAFGEGFSNAVVEGMAAGLPAVVTNVGDSKRIVGDTGLVVPPGDPEALARAIRSLLDEPPDARARRGMRARKRVIEHFSLKRCLESFDATYRGEKVVRPAWADASA